MIEMTYKYAYPVIGRELQQFLSFLLMLLVVVALAGSIGATSGVDMTAGELGEVQTAGVPIPDAALYHANEKGVEQMPLFSIQSSEGDLALL